MAHQSAPFNNRMVSKQKKRPRCIEDENGPLIIIHLTTDLKLLKGTLTLNESQVIENKVSM